MGGGEPTINEIIALANPVKLPAPSRLGRPVVCRHRVSHNVRDFITVHCYYVTMACDDVTSTTDDLSVSLSIELRESLL